MLFPFPEREQLTKLRNKPSLQQKTKVRKQAAIFTLKCFIQVEDFEAG
jgi:hypothetical protein